MKTLVTFLLLIFLAPVSFAQAEVYGLPPIRNFSPNEYHAAIDNWSCVQDKRGILYFANESGVLEYDGGRWNIIKINGDKPVRSLALDSTGRIYAGCINDFGYLDINETGATQFISLRSFLPDTTKLFQEVWKTHVLGDAIIFHSDNTIYKYSKNHITVIPVISAQDYSFTLNGRLFVYQREIGLSEILKDTVVVVPGGNYYKDKRIRVMLPYGKKSFLIGTENGIYIYDGKSSRRFFTEADNLFASSRIFSGVMINDSQYIFGTLGAGVVLLDNKGKLIYNIDKKRGLLTDMAFNICSDREQGVWIAQIGGISRIDFSGPVTIFDNRSGLDAAIFSLTRHKAKLLLGTINGVYEKEISGDGSFRPKILPSQDIPALYSFEDGFLAGCSEGTFFYSNGTIKKISPAYAVSFTRSSVNPNLVYAADYSIRLLYYHNKKWIDKGSIPGISESVFRCIENADGSLWLFTFYEGIIYVSNHFHDSTQMSKTVIIRYGIDEGLPSLNFNSPVIIGGKLFFSTIKGLYSFDSIQQKFVFDSEIHSLFSPALPAIRMTTFERKNGDIYIAGEHKRWETEILYYRRKPGGKYKAFPTSAGLLKNFNVTPVLNEDDISWYVSGSNLFRFDMSKERKAVPFDTRISKASFIGKDTSIYFGINKSNNSAVEIPFSYNTLRFEFSGMSYVGDKNEFRYILEGMDEAWSNWSTEQYKEYSVLPPGEYRFRVHSKNPYGETGSESSFTFIILPPWWSTWWFRAGIVFIGIAAVFIFTQKISARRIASLKLEEEKMKNFSKQLIESQEKERKRISSELHDSIGQNLLIIKNMLDVSVEGSISKDELNIQLKELSKIASLSIEETRSIASNLHPYQLNRMGLTKALNAMMRNLEASTKLNITYSLDDLQGLLDKETEAHLYRIVQESVNNVLKHSEASSLTFCLKRNSGELQILISDDGKGFNIKEVEAGTGSLIGGLGLFGLKERARIIGGTLNIKSHIGRGTNVEIAVPISKEYNA